MVDFPGDSTIYFDPAIIGRFTAGRVVVNKRPVYGDDVIGHVVGFGISSVNEIVIDVKWSGRRSGGTKTEFVCRQYSVHPNNLVVLGDEGSLYV